MGKSRISGLEPLRRVDLQFSLGRLLIAMTLAAVLLPFGRPLFAHPAGWGLLLMGLLIILFLDLSVWDIVRGDIALRGKDYPVAVCNYTRAIRARPYDAERYCRRALAFLAQGNFALALSDCTEAIKIDSRYATGWAGRAAVRQALGDHRGAVDDATVALCIVPADGDTWLVRGSSCTALGDMDGALQDLTECIQLAPDNAMACGLRGTVYLAVERYREAGEDFDRARQAGADWQDVVLGRCLASFKLGHYRQAFQQLADFLDQHPEVADAHWAQAWFLATCPDGSLRDGQRALEYAREAQRLGGSVHACETALAAAYAELGVFDRAVEHAERALEAAPTFARGRFEARLATHREQQPYRDYGAANSG